MDLEDLEREHAKKTERQALVSNPTVGSGKGLTASDTQSALDQIEEWERYMEHGVRAFHRLYTGD